MIRVVRYLFGNRCHALPCITLVSTRNEVSAIGLFRRRLPQFSKIVGENTGKIRALSTSYILFDIKDSFGSRPNEDPNTDLSSDIQTVVPASSSQLKLTPNVKDVALHTFLEPGDNGGHIIFASEDAINPLLTEIRFARDAVVYNYPYVWFRDHCRCTSCVDSSFRSKVTAESLDPNIEPIMDQTTTLGSAVSIRWKDDHFSKYPANWLWAYRFGGKYSQDFLDSSTVVKWDAENISSTIRRFDFACILEEDQSLFDWLLEMKMTGLAVIENVPSETQQVHKLGARVGFLRSCHFGSSLAENISYTSRENKSHQSLQTDLPYSSYPPSVHLLHCCSISGEENTNGVKLQLSDGFYVSEVLQDCDPECLEILSKVEWEYFDFGYGESGEFHQRARHPVIRLDPHGNVLQVVFNDSQRGPKLNIPADFVSQAYETLKKFIDVAASKENVYEYSLQPGEIITRDNYRVLQRRRAITSKDLEVQVEGAFIEWDEIYSKLRVLFARQC